jgi:hypothetical protein
MAARLRMDAPILVIGLIVGIIGIAALLMHTLRGGRAGRLLLWFSAFSILYGTRIVVASVFVNEVFGVAERFRRWPDALIAGSAAVYIAARSVLMTRGCGCERALRALRNNRLAASASRKAESRKSMVAPAESIARYK